MRQRTLLAFAALTGLAVLPALAVRAGEPSSIWFLRFRHDAPNRITLGDEYGGRRVDVYWYMLYNLENDGEEDRRIFIDITASSDKDRRYQDGYHPQVYERILKRVRVAEGDDLELWSQREVTTPSTPGAGEVTAPRPLGEPFELNLRVLKKGEVRRCVAIFHAMDNEMNHLVVDVRGLTNDIRTEATNDHERKVTEWVYRIEYSRPGDEYYTPDDPITLVREGWEEVESVVRTDLK
ncbi:MAG: hypothetical protein HY722_16045 [Planctomycetes bacterium]|nr:hypothetical protein [Planctomycetota bacterium]